MINNKNNNIYPQTLPDISTSRELIYEVNTNQVIIEIGVKL